MNDARGKRGEPDVVTLVHVESPRERHDELSLERAGDQRPGVTGDGGGRESPGSSRNGIVAIGCDLVGEAAESRTKDDRRDSGTFAAESRRDRRRGRARLPGAERSVMPHTPPLSAAMSARRASDQPLAFLPGQERARESVQRDRR